MVRHTSSVSGHFRTLCIKKLKALYYNNKLTFMKATEVEAARLYACFFVVLLVLTKNKVRNENKIK